MRLASHAQRSACASQVPGLKVGTTMPSPIFYSLPPLQATLVIFGKPPRWPVQLCNPQILCSAPSKGGLLRNAGLTLPALTSPPHFPNRRQVLMKGTAEVARHNRAWL